jgi:hypothetical protein
MKVLTWFLIGVLYYAKWLEYRDNFIVQSGMWLNFVKPLNGKEYPTLKYKKDDFKLCKI